MREQHFKPSIVARSESQEGKLPENPFNTTPYLILQQVGIESKLSTQLQVHS